MTTVGNNPFDDFINRLCEDEPDSAFGCFVDTLSEHYNYPYPPTIPISSSLLDLAFTVYNASPSYQNKHVCLIKYLLNPHHQMDDDYGLVIGTLCCSFIAQKTPHLIDLDIVNAVIDTGLEQSWSQNFHLAYLDTLSQITTHCPTHKDTIIDAFMASAYNATGKRCERAWYLLSYLNSKNILSINTSMMISATQAACFGSDKAEFFLKHQHPCAEEIDPISFPVIHGLIDTGYTNRRFNALRLAAKIIDTIAENRQEMLTSDLARQFATVAAHAFQATRPKSPLRTGESESILTILKLVAQHHPDILSADAVHEAEQALNHSNETGALPPTLELFRWQPQPTAAS